MRTKYVIATLMSLIIFFAGQTAGSIYALTSTKPLTVKNTKSPSISVGLSKNKKLVNMNFSNLLKVQSIKYQFSYNTSKGPQGIKGTIKLKKNTNVLSRSLTLGTCSSGSCVYHKGISNIKLTLDYYLTTGGIISAEKSVR